MKPCVFIHSNHRQMVGAIVSKYSLVRNSPNADRFDVRILDTADHPFLREREGQSFLRDGDSAVWHFEDLQSFTPLRFMPPEIMGYEGRAVVIDPDIFAVGDIWELLQRDMQGKAIVCRPRAGNKGLRGCMASSVMLLDCAKLTHWKVEEQFAELFAFERDYMDWICLHCEPKETIGLFEDEWNDFDHLTPRTKLLHNTKRQTQPWKTGLPVDYVPAKKRFKLTSPKSWIRPMQRRLRGGNRLLGTYSPHPDPAQERFFFGLLRECIDQGVISEDRLRQEMERNHVRHDAFEVLERLPSRAA